MNNLRQRKYLFALLALLLVFAACKGESPTAPPPISGPGPGTGTPPTGATVNVTVSNPNPLTDSSTTITATVTIGNQPAPAGTAVEFSTTLGRFEDTGANTSLRTTNAQGQATVSLTSSAAGTANVTVVVNNVVQRTTVTFSPRPVTPPPPPGASITRISPEFGPFEGGTPVTITGVGFSEPVRVFFDLGNGNLREAFVTSVTPTSIQVLAPRVDGSAGQTLPAAVVVFINQGTPAEQRLNAPTQFTYRRDQLTPVVRSVSPSSGPLEGGTRVTIFGDAFESFVQVFFGLAEAQIVNVTFDQIVVMTPNARDTTVDASPATGQVPIRVVNVRSGTQTTFTQGFRYMPNMRITAVGPTEGPFTGGTRVEIDGIGFDDPVAVTIGGVAAQPIQVTGTKIIAITGGVVVQGCADVPGPISVTNISTGLSATADPLQFTFRVPRPVILSVSDPVALGGVITVRVLNAFGISRLRVGDANLPITSSTDNGDGTTTFTAIVPTSLQLQTEACPGLSGISAPRTTAFNVTYESASSGCTDTLNNGVRITPPPAPVIAVSGTFTPATSTVTAGNPGSAGPPVVDPTNATATQPPPQQVILANIGTALLQVTGRTQTDGAGRGCAAFDIAAFPAEPPLPLDRCEAMTLNVRYLPPAQTSPTPTTDPGSSCRITVTTNAGDRVFTVTGSTQ